MFHEEEICELRARIAALESKCSNAKVYAKSDPWAQINIVKEQQFRSKPDLSMENDMVRVTLDMPRRVWMRFGKKEVKYGNDR